MRCQISLLHSPIATYAKCTATNTYIISINEKYYHVDEGTFDKLVSEDNIVANESIFDSIIPFMVMIVTMALGFALSILECMQLKHTGLNPSVALITEIGSVDRIEALFIAYILANLCVHEAGHAIALKCFYPHAKTRLGFKFTFIFPTFYIASSDSYMLPRFKRAAVHLAGNFANSLLTLFCLLLFPHLARWTWYVTLLEISNLIPVMKSDGYNCIQSLVDKYAIKMDRNQERKSDAIRGLITLPIAVIVTCLLNSIFE